MDGLSQIKYKSKCRVRIYHPDMNLIFWEAMDGVICLNVLKTKLFMIGPNF